MPATTHVPPLPDPGARLPTAAAHTARLAAWKGQATSAAARLDRIAMWEQQQ